MMRTCSIRVGSLVLGAIFCARALAEPQGLHRAYDQHRVAFRTERVSKLLERYVQLDSASQEELAASLESTRRAGTPAEAPLTPVAVSDALHELTGVERSNPQRRLDRIADSIDLIPAPGAIDARPSGIGEPITVHVYPNGTIKNPPDIELALYWITPQGEEKLARREPVAAEVLGSAGFEMFVRAPISGPSTWSLVPECRVEELTSRGAPVQIEVVELLEERTHRVLTRDFPQDSAARELTRSFALRVQRGMRIAVALSTSEALRALEVAGEDGFLPSGGSPVPARVAYVDRRGDSHWAWGMRRSKLVERAVIVLAPSHTQPEALLMREDWSSLVDQGAWVLATHIPPDPDSMPGFLSLLEHVRRETISGEVTMIVLGDALGQIERVAPDAKQPPWDSMIICSGRPLPKAESLLDRTPRLLVAPKLDVEWPEALDSWNAATFLGVRGSAVSALNQVQLADYVSKWWELRAGR